VTVRVFRVDDQRRLVSLAALSPSELASTDEPLLWCDLRAPTDAQLAAYMQALELGSLPREILRGGGERPGLYPLKSELVLAVPVLAKGEAEGADDMLALICRERLVLTLHGGDRWEERAPHLYESGSWLPARSTGALVATAVLDLTLDDVKRASTLRGRINALELRMERDPVSVSPDEIVLLRAPLAALTTVVADQLPVVQALSTLDKPYFQLGEARDYLQVALINLTTCQRACEALEQRLGELRTAFQMYAQEKMNRRLNTLTVLSAIFMPISLLAGIWGMNFASMPELDIPHAYPLARRLVRLTIQEAP
jgi:magnesium transporter